MRLTHVLLSTIPFVLPLLPAVSALSLPAAHKARDCVPQTISGYPVARALGPTGRPSPPTQRITFTNNPSAVPLCYSPSSTVDSRRFTMTACDYSTNPPPVAIQCTENCGSGGYFGVVGTSTDAGYGTPEQIYLKYVGQDWLQPSQVDGYSHQFSNTEKAAVWQVDLDTYQLHLTWDGTGAEYLPYLMTNSAGHQVLTMATTAPAGAQPMALFFVISS